MHAKQEDATTIKVSWAYTTENQGFKIEMSVDGEDGSIMEAVDDTFVQIHDVEPFTKYKFTVKAIVDQVEKPVGECELTSWPGSKLTRIAIAQTKSKMNLRIQISNFTDILKVYCKQFNDELIEIYYNKRPVYRLHCLQNTDK